MFLCDRVYGSCCICVQTTLSVFVMVLVLNYNHECSVALTASWSLLSSADWSGLCSQSHNCVDLLWAGHNKLVPLVLSIFTNTSWERWGKAHSLWKKHLNSSGVNLRHFAQPIRNTGDFTDSVISPAAALFPGRESFQEDECSKTGRRRTRGRRTSSLKWQEHSSLT